MELSFGKPEASLAHQFESADSSKNKMEIARIEKFRAINTRNKMVHKETMICPYC